ncbi:PREDICTED: sodium-dependent neutral amino acid transporter B(0)AT2 [Myotis brandtii]|uniref:sodium-dependent neutral amino acid transporter B(0)AT2 n=1 Tax=Myotis brandtii TaxID=109478 RepID=UPI0003BBE7F6|nr:PREDICTED: sodium-dependent neutral amino acid transporter B(0)AT2 [Myotis brandtii]XP_005860916.1 PREDICTED: sodium-dependent neutral amino acid transporter B(0)AT2 [Myotis brandtii]XP_005860917.1 PREDICTED: sodium-dependent neutral amino acid transporter B(0)AT2 [Myotis brandtii]XP_005860918.1 PREDICTED: sodium-dependent neutral amino acid transporter B(0)AT2 [Myotis brandtii]
MPKNSKMIKKELEDEVIESAKDLLSNEDAADDAFKKSELIVDVQKENHTDPKVSNIKDERRGWNNRLQYILAQIGFSVGLGNVWRFPYLCQKNGGGAYLLPFFILLMIVGIPLFFLELALGQRIRRGSIGVWNYISPKLGGIGFTSCVVSLFVAFYYNVIIGWSVFYFSQSFQFPLPWDNCPLVKNATHTLVEPECEKSSDTTYYWYRKALDISSSISEGGGLNWKMTISLLVAWAMVCFAMIKGIQSSEKIVYFSSLSPYVILICFLVRSLFLEGSIYGIRHMFTPQLEKMLEPQTWREAATQVFFALDLGFGGVIAFSSYSKRDNNCQFDAVLVPLVNFFTSILATLVVFAVLGFKANVINKKCIEENAIMIEKFLKMGSIPQAIIPPHIKISTITAEAYHEVYDIIKRVKGEEFPALDLRYCKVEDELNKEVQGIGLAFIAFTEAMTHFPLAPLWSVLFFLMLINLGLSSMFGFIEGIITPVVDSFKVSKELVTVICCLLAFCIGLIFVQRSGNYFVVMFDGYSATLPLLIVVIFENIAVSFVYGADKFMEDLRDMLGFAPYRYYYYLWKYITPLVLVFLLITSTVNMILSPPGYDAWNKDKASKEFLRYPTWAMVICISVVVLALLPIPAVFIIRCFNLMENSSGNLASVAYKRGRVLKEPVNLEGDDASLIHENSSEMSSPNLGKNIYRKQSGSPTLDTAPNGRYGIGYLMADVVDMPDLPESDL